MDLIFKCWDCGKELELHEIHTIPGQEIVDPFTGLKWGTGKRLCLECYKNNTTRAINIWEKGSKTIRTINIETKKEAKISELEADSNFDKIKVAVVKKISEEKKLKYGKELILGKFEVKDDSGKIILTLWGNKIKKIKEGEVLIIENGYVRDFMNEKYLTLGKGGVLTVLE